MPERRKNTLKKAKIAFMNLTIPQKIAKATSVVGQMTGNANFTTPDPALADVTAKVASMENVQAAADAIRTASVAQTALMHRTEEELDAMITKLGSYVTDTSAGDEAKILSSGFAVADTPGPVGELYPPQDFYGTPGDEEGEVNLMWNRLKNVGKHTYNVFGRKYGSGEDFVLMAGTDQTKVDIKGLDPGVKYDFYVVGVKENQPGPASETIVVKAG